MLSSSEIAAFERDGVVALRGVVPADLVAACRDQVDLVLWHCGVDPEDPATWTQPVVRVMCPVSAEFRTAGTMPALWEVYDQLLGPGRWRPHQGMGGTIPVRFPHHDDPGDAGWHLDGGYVGPDGTYWINRASRGRGLLVLFLLDDVGPDDAPTELKMGSHLDLPAVLAPFGDEGASFLTVAEHFPPATLERESAFATGAAGDVFVCHPFLVHRATWPHRGTRPRAIAQPGVVIDGQFALDGGDAFPVERAISRAG